MKLDQALCLFRDFLSPVQKLDKLNINKISLETILRNINTNFQSNHLEYLMKSKSGTIFTDDNESDELWRFALISMAILETLNTAEFEKSPNNCYLRYNDFV